MRPSLDDVSNYPLRRSTIPLDSECLGSNNTSFTAKVPMDATTLSARREPRPIPGSLPQMNWRGTVPIYCNSSQDPNSRSSALLAGIVRPVPNFECAVVIAGNSFAAPCSSGIFRGGNQKSHCAASPGSQTNRPAGSLRRCPGRSRFTFSRNQRIDPVQPTRSPSTVAGMSAPITAPLLVPRTE